MLGRCGLGVMAGLTCLVSLSLAACGSGDDDDGDTTPALGTCDVRSRSHSCIELQNANARNLESQESGCLDTGGTWSNAECPVEERLGCCEYTFGSHFRECFYTGITRDYEAYCAMFDDSVWTPDP